MKRQLLILVTLAVVLVSIPMESAYAADGRGRGRGGGGVRGFSRSHGHGFRNGFGFDGFGGGYDGWDIAELYRQLYNNLPYFALHPPVYYSYPVPRTYGYSPFAYMPDVMTPDINFCPEPETIINPYVPSSQQTQPKTEADKTASNSRQPQPLVIINPYVTGERAIAQTQ